MKGNISYYKKICNFKVFYIRTNILIISKFNIYCLINCNLSSNWGAGLKPVASHKTPIKPNKQKKACFHFAMARKNARLRIVIIEEPKKLI